MNLMGAWHMVRMSKLVAALGVVALILASVGVYLVAGDATAGPKTPSGNDDTGIVSRALGI